MGLAGFPNVGKSTLLSVVSQARPEIANYHFTTITPVLGVVRIEMDKSFVMADIPGLIEGASQGVGLGHDFLRHIDRCRLLVHVVDVSGIEGRDPIEDFKIISGELESFSPELAKKPLIVAGNKCDIASPEDIGRFREFVEGMGLAFFEISGATRQGVDALMKEIASLLDTLPPIKMYEPEPNLIAADGEIDKNAFSVIVEDGVYVIEAPWLANVLGAVNMEDYESLQYFQRVLRRSGIIDKLEEMGIEEDATVRVFDLEFEYVR